MEDLSRQDREKKNREEEIIIAAEKIFSLKGFDNASMDEIAKQAQFTKRTLYKYFLNKEDLYFAVALKLFKIMFTYSKEAIEKGNSGFEKVRLSGLAQYQFYKDFPNASQLFTYIGFIKKIEKNSPRRQEWLNFDNNMFNAFIKILEEGKKDGSIRKDVDATKTTYSLVFIMTGFFHMLSQTGKTFTEHFILSMDEFVYSTLDLLFNTIRSK